MPLATDDLYDWEKVTALLARDEPWWQPGTASGVTFMTLEDETGFVNLVLWKQVFDAHAVIAKTATFLGVTGRLQSEQGVVHVIVDQVRVPEVVAPTEVGSRDFH